MKITHIEVRAGRVFNHPYESYSNLQPSVVLQANLEEGDDPDEAVRQLQAKAEGLVEDHKRSLLGEIEELYHLSQAQQEAHSLEASMERAQARLKKLREDHPEAFSQQQLLTEDVQAPEADES